jgi:pimeloyl-ACP methyl ester carboxylesterase
MGWPEPTASDGAAQDYRIAEESFELYVPGGCRRLPGCGLLVWISATGSGHLPLRWKGALDDARLVWVGANRSGDERALAVRVNLALDAAENARRLLALDPERVFVAGFAGGGRAASVAAFLYPDVFLGGVFLMGAEFFEPVPAADRARTRWPPAFPPPPESLLARARERGHYVFATAGDDAGGGELRDLARGARSAGFRHVSLLEAPGRSQAQPSADTFRRALALLP